MNEQANSLKALVEVKGEGLVANSPTVHLSAVTDGVH